MPKSKQITRPVFIDNITIQSESNQVPMGGVTLDTVAEFDELLRKIALHREPCGGYDKTFFCITCCDGAKYEGRMDVKYINEPQETATGELGLMHHIKSHIDYYTGPSAPSYVKPDHVESCHEWAIRLGL